jgi:hypothetical protein
VTYIEQQKEAHQKPWESSPLPVPASDAYKNAKAEKVSRMSVFTLHMTKSKWHKKTSHVE